VPIRFAYLWASYSDSPSPVATFWLIGIGGSIVSLGSVGSFCRIVVPCESDGWIEEACLYEVAPVCVRVLAHPDGCTRSTCCTKPLLAVPWGHVHSAPVKRAGSNFFRLFFTDFFPDLNSIGAPRVLPEGRPMRFAAFF